MPYITITYANLASILTTAENMQMDTKSEQNIASYATLRQKATWEGAPPTPTEKLSPNREKAFRYAEEKAEKRAAVDDEDLVGGADKKVKIRERSKRIRERKTKTGYSVEYKEGSQDE